MNVGPVSPGNHGIPDLSGNPHLRPRLMFQSKKDLQTLQFGVNIYHRLSVTPRTCEKLGSKVQNLGVYLCRQCHP
jgi:hypothetical protein